MLGLYVSDHPLFGSSTCWPTRRDTSIAALPRRARSPTAQVVTLAGILSGVQRRITKQGKAWASATLEDLDGAVEVLFFPNTYELVGAVHRRGRDRGGQGPGRPARRPAPDHGDGHVHARHHRRRTRPEPVVLALPPTRCTPPLVERLKEVLASHPGTAEVHLKLVNGVAATLLRLGPLRVTPTTALMGDLKALLGPGSIAG